MMARRSKLTDEVQEQICESIRLGATYELAAQAAGVSYRSFARWMHDGEQAKWGRKRQFWQAVGHANADAALGWLTVINEAAQNGTWQAAARLLERRFPDQYGRRVVQQEHSGPEGKPIPVTTIVVERPDTDVST